MDQWIRPIDGRDEAASEHREPVVAFYVRQLVAKYGKYFIV